jgi:hypothetical protein
MYRRAGLHFDAGHGCETLFDDDVYFKVIAIAVVKETERARTAAGLATQFLKHKRLEHRTEGLAILVECRGVHPDQCARHAGVAHVEFRPLHNAAAGWYARAEAARGEHAFQYGDVVGAGRWRL